MQQKKGGIDKI